MQNEVNNVEEKQTTTDGEALKKGAAEAATETEAAKYTKAIDDLEKRFLARQDTHKREQEQTIAGYVKALEDMKAEFEIKLSKAEQRIDDAVKDKLRGKAALGPEKDQKKETIEDIEKEAGLPPGTMKKM